MAAEMSSKERRAARDVVGTRMKAYEDEHNPKLDAGLPFVVRLDGHAFSKFTGGLVKPYDSRLSAAMVATTMDVMKKFNAATAYTHSDEISLVFGPADVDNGQTLAYKGKVVKLCSLVAGYTSVRFHMRMAEFVWSDLKEKTQALIAAGEAHFDARAFSLPSAEEVLANLQWRSGFDCRRNSVSMLARRYYSAKALTGVSTGNVIRMLAEEFGVRWDEQPLFFRFGSIFKKEMFTIDAVDRKTGLPVEAVRSRIVARSFDFSAPPPGFADMMLAKYWADDFDPSRDLVITIDSVAAATHASTLTASAPLDDSNASSP